MKFFTEPDSNVRPPGQRLRGRPRARPLRRLARLLLLSQPRALARFTLLFVVASMSACIIPVAPEFQDPIASPNFSPVLVSASPDFGSLVAIVTAFEFTVTATDPNVGDDLYYRWFVDYPPRTSNTRRISLGEVPHRADGKQLTAIIQTSVDCTDGLASTANSLHQLALFVADRPFVTSDTDVADVDPPGMVATQNWTFQINCPTAPPPPSQ